MIHADSRTEERATKLALIGIFMSALGAFALPPLRRLPPLKLGPMDLLLLGLTTFRMGNMLAYERIADPIREPFAERIQEPETGVETIVPRGQGVQRVLGELFACPICAGTWAAAGLVFGLHVLPRPTRAFMAIMSATGIAHILKVVAGALDGRAGSLFGR